METLVFHSVKGGVGRTLALANLGVALARAGKKVLMLDFDYTAPGLHRKFGLPSAPGYIEYLRDATLEERCQGSAGKHWEKLADKIRPAGKYHDANGTGGLYLLGAGDDTQKDYWAFLASYNFHRLFYFTQEEISGLTNMAFAPENLVRNRLAFEGDLALIQKELNPDYLLVDCKTGPGEKAAVTLLWADRIAHFFPHNAEGRFYALEIARSVARLRSREGRDIGFVPVVTRVPDDFAEEEKNTLRQEMADAWEAWLAVAKIPFFRHDDFIFLSELRDMEARERLLVNAADASPDRRWLLAHDQVELFARIAPPDKNACTEKAEDAWYARLSMKREDKQFLKIFINSPRLGTMLNVADAQPNIAFRVRTLHLMYQTLLQSVEDDDGKVCEALRKTGYAAGKDFAEEFANLQRDGDLLYRLECWANFDSGVGFGQIGIIKSDFSATPLSGTIRVTGDAFHRLPIIDDGVDEKQDLRGIFVGYVQAVVEKLSGIQNVLVEGVDDAPSPLGNASLYKFRSSNQ